MSDMPEEIWVRYCWYEPDWTSDVDCISADHKSYTRTDIHKALLEQYKVLVAALDKHHGTPCEQIRHDQALSKAKERIEQLEGVLATAGNILNDVNVNSDFIIEALDEEFWDNQIRRIQAVETIDELSEEDQSYVLQLAKDISR